ncbi:MAG: DUF1778 domain-containing protein [Gammaproteobacteria bacterium]|nr:DUF1778 domain-containing protein [Candidatus Thioaporhodococcus sediminis]TNF50886.1 MAG: DUF1778 domain-containing protein [Gammaproteobacteria bacterium]
MPRPNLSADVKARIGNDLHAMLKHPATLQGRSKTDFVVTAVQAAAQQAIEQAQSTRLLCGSASDQPTTT